MNKPRSFEEVQTMLTQLESRLAKIENQDIDLHGRKVTNAGSAKVNSDYVTLSDLLSQIDAIVTTTPKDSSSSTSTTNLTILKSLPTIKIKKASDTTYTRFAREADNTGFISSNLYNNGSGWLVDDATKIGCMLYLATNSNIVYYLYPVGGPLTQIFQLSPTAVGFFGAAAVVKQILSAYTTAARSSAYASTPAALASAARLVDLNDLRTAYENLRLAYDDLRTKLQTSTFIG